MIHTLTKQLKKRTLITILSAASCLSFHKAYAVFPTFDGTALGNLVQQVQGLVEQINQLSQMVDQTQQLVDVMGDMNSDKLKVLAKAIVTTAYKRASFSSQEMNDITRHLPADQRPGDGELKFESLEDSKTSVNKMFLISKEDKNKASTTMKMQYKKAQEEAKKIAARDGAALAYTTKHKMTKEHEELMDAIQKDMNNTETVKDELGLTIKIELAQLSYLSDINLTLASLLLNESLEQLHDSPLISQAGVSDSGNGGGIGLGPDEEAKP